MPESFSTLSPAAAWQPLPAAAWDEAAARHLLQRLGWTAPGAATARARREGPAATVARAFARMPAFSKPALIAQLERDTPALQRRAGREAGETERRAAQQELRERSREALGELTVQWLGHAAQPEHAAAEKWLLLLQDVWVVGAEKVRHAGLIFRHQALLRQTALTNYPEVARAMTRSPAMILYLDLQQSRAGAPNENFARELFELFTLGEGHYTEGDIKEAARAFTGYRQQLGEFRFQRRQHDAGRKTIFGATGNFDGDAVLDLVFRQPAAGTFLPRELARFYLSDTPLPEPHLAALGAAWTRERYSLPWLLGTFFTSRAFFAAEYRGNFIKSPLQFYLGLLQDLGLDSAPFAPRLLAALRQMGQTPFNPPNVRGWVGGRAWINSATLFARRQLVNALLAPLDESVLNADELFALDVAASNGQTNFTVAPARFEAWAALPPAAAAQRLLDLALPARRGSPLEAQLAAQLAGAAGRSRAELRDALATLLESPDYQLC